jgi:hypothetical protein
MKAAIAGVLVGALIGVAACMHNDIKDSRDKHQEILALSTQIREFKSNMGIPLTPSPQALMEARKVTATQQRHDVCPDHHDVPKTCNETCNLSDDICDNAERICQIASELPPDDDFAKSKCDDAKASCREGKQKCCECGSEGKP